MILLAEATAMPNLDAIHYVLGGAVGVLCATIVAMGTSYAAKLEAYAAKIESMAEDRRKSEMALAGEVIPLAKDLVCLLESKEDKK